MLAALIATVGIGGTDGNISVLERLVEHTQRQPGLQAAFNGRSQEADRRPRESEQVDAAPILWVLARPPLATVASLSLLQGAASARQNRSSTGGIRLPEMSDVLGEQAVEAIICADPWACFRQGYRDFDGNPEWEDRFVDVIDTCESRDNEWDDTYPLYISRAQFHPDSWERVVDATGLSNSASPYHVGGNIAWWSNTIDPSGSAGWGGLNGEGCW